MGRWENGVAVRWNQSNRGYGVLNSPTPQTVELGCPRHRGAPLSTRHGTGGMEDNTVVGTAVFFFTGSQHGKGWKGPLWVI